MWLFTSPLFCMSNSLCVLLASPAMSDSNPEFLSLPISPTYSILPRLWLFSSILKQSKGALAKTRLQKDYLTTYHPASRGKDSY